MSMHRIPLTDIERAGLVAHGLNIGTPSQLSDVFRQGIAWAILQNEQRGEQDVNWLQDQTSVEVDKAVAEEREACIEQVDAMVSAMLAEPLYSGNMAMDKVVAQGILLLQIELLRKVSDSLRARGVTQLEICPNCDTAMPLGCEGLFKNYEECMWRQQKD